MSPWFITRLCCLLVLHHRESSHGAEMSGPEKGPKNCTCPQVCFIRIHTCEYEWNRLVVWMKQACSPHVLGTLWAGALQETRVKHTISVCTGRCCELCQRGCRLTLGWHPCFTCTPLLSLLAVVTQAMFQMWNQQIVDLSFIFFRYLFRIFVHSEPNTISSLVRYESQAPPTTSAPPRPLSSPSHLSPAQSCGPHSTSSLGVGAACLLPGSSSPSPGTPDSVKERQCTTRRTNHRSRPRPSRPHPSYGCCGRWRRSAVAVVTSGGDGRGVMHDGSGIRTAAGCCFLHWFRNCWTAHLLLRRRGGGFRDDGYSGDGGRCHGWCWRGDAGSEMMRWMKGMWRAGPVHLWTPLHDPPTSPWGRPVPGSPCYLGHCSSADWWWCRRGLAAGGTPHTSAGLPLLRSCAPAPVLRA